MAKRTSNPLLAVALCRVSTDADRQELGVQAQKDDINAWAAKAGVTIVAWHIEEVSGGASFEKRPTLLAALADVAEHRAGFLVVQRLDRLSRDSMTALLAEMALSKSGAELATADGVGAGSDPASVFLRTVLVGASGLEKAWIALRIKKALAVKRTRGEMTGSAPYGYRVELETRNGKEVKVLVPDAEEQATVAVLRDLRTGLTFREVVDEAARIGVVSRSGKPFGLGQISKMLAHKSDEATGT